MTLGKYVYQNRTKRGLSQRDLAKIAKVDHSMICKIENNRRKGRSILPILKIADALELDKGYVLKLAGYKENDLELLLIKESI